MAWYHSITNEDRRKADSVSPVSVLLAVEVAPFNHARQFLGCQEDDNTNL